MGLRATKIDTLSLAKELENAGIPRAQAEAQIQTTIKVVEMTIEEKLVTKHDLTQALHHTEEKLLAEISKLHATDEKLFAEISKTENRLMAEIDRLHRADEKLSDRIDKLDERLSTKIDKLESDVNELKNKTDHISTTLEHMPSSIVNKLYKSLGSLIALGFTAMGLLIALHH